ncbi:MAG: phospholipase D-like domain-containing protein [Peptococcaceae bacterium]|nr:phospholipase D-like domain-containing protein [Peptococcaceae bacterium]
MSLFVGRDDVFAKRWENVEKGSNGYVPVCGNEWSPSCPKYGGGKMRCGSCPNHNFVRYDKSAVEKHLKGLMTVGVYPMSPDETRRFLVFDFDGKGTLQQYAGRLHRLYDGKKEVQVYDYVDVHVAMLEKMYQKRLRGYAAIGYKTKGTPQPLEEARAIFDERTFFPVYCADVLAANSEILIVSPFVAKRRVLAALNYLTAAKAKVTVITKPPENYVPKDRGKITECVELLKQHDITVKTKERIHQKFAIMDQRVVWYGSINFLSYGASGESVMRIENLDVAGELSRGV